MNIRKYWLNDDIFVYAIDDNDQREEYPTKTGYYLGRKGFGVIISWCELPDEDNYPADEKEFITASYTCGNFNGLIDELYSLE